MCPGLVRVGVFPRRFDDHVHTKVFPRQVFYVRDLQDFYFPAVYYDCVVFCFDGSRKSAVNRIILEQIGSLSRIGSTVGRDYVKQAFLVVFKKSP